MRERVVGRRVFVLFWMAVFTLALLMVASKVQGQTPRPSIAFDTRPNTHNMMPGADEPTRVGYSGRYYVHLQERGPFVVHADAGSFRMDSGAGIDFCTPGTCYSAPHVHYHGDCKQTANAMAASPGVAKWVVTVGTPPPSCNDACGVPWKCVTAAAGCTWKCDQPVVNGELMVWRLDGAGLRWVGQVDCPAVTDTVQVYPTLDGDFAYLQEKRFGTPTFTKVDLNLMATVASGLTSRPAWNPQTSIDGYTYALAVNPVQPKCGVVTCTQPVAYTMTRQGGATPTPTLPPAPPPTVTPPLPVTSQFDDAIYQVDKEGYMVGCAPNMFCPDDKLSRQQFAAVVLKIIHGPTYIPPACASPGKFLDVPCTP